LAAPSMIPSLPLVLPLVFAFVFYSFVNIIKSSIVIPAKRVSIMISSFVAMIVVTVAGFLLTKNALDPLISMSYFVALGSLVGLLFMSFFSSSDLNIKIFGWKHLLLFAQVLGMSLTFMIQGLGLKFCCLWFLLLYCWR